MIDPFWIDFFVYPGNGLAPHPARLIDLDRKKELLNRPCSASAVLHRHADRLRFETARSAHSIYGSFIIRLSYLDTEGKGILSMIIAPSDASPKASVFLAVKKRRKECARRQKKRCFTHLQICSMTSTSTLLSAGE